MEQLKEEYHLDAFAYSFVLEYLKLDVKKRNLFRYFFYNVLNGMNTDDELPKGSFPEKRIQSLTKQTALTVENEQAKKKHSVSIWNASSLDRTKQAAGQRLPLG